MAIGPRLEQRLGQSLVMTPQLRQAIKLLQLSNLELNEFVEQELEKNPLLEAQEADGPMAPETPAPADADRFDGAATEGAADQLRQAGADVSEVDGVRVRTADGWWLLRASNTQDVLVARCEAADEAGLDRLKQALAEQLRGSDMEPPQF